MHAEGKLLDAERILRNIAGPGAHRRLGLSALAELYLAGQRLNEAIGVLQELVAEDPENFDAVFKLANTLATVGRGTDATDVYAAYLCRVPGDADAHFNVALLYQQSRKFDDALLSYESALSLGIANIEEVYCNLGAVHVELRQDDVAKRMFERALQECSDYVPALYNLATQYEEIGDLTRATDLLEQIQSLDINHWQSLARLAHSRRATDQKDPIIARLSDAIDGASSSGAREALCYASAKVFDDLGKFEQASALFVAANEMGRPSRQDVDNASVERAFSSIIKCFDDAWFEERKAASMASPIFICGMYRSGSTLLEQMLAEAFGLTGAGELDTLPRLLGRYLAPFPKNAESVSVDVIRQMSDEYVSELSDFFPQSRHIIDKRPDNFLHLGLIKAMFPEARIIVTRRNPLDNCLSIYFQQLDPVISYACDLRRTAHYRSQHDRLLDHWTQCFGDSIHVVDYEELVTDRETVLERLGDYLAMRNIAQSSDGQGARSRVKTASVWQVRENIHIRSVRRWRHYRALAGILSQEFSRFGPRYGEIEL